MSNKQMLKVLVNERLSEAAEEIFALFEQATAEYQRELHRLKNVHEEKPMEVVPSPDTAQQTLTVGQENEENTEETEELTIALEDESQITTVESLRSEDELQPNEAEEQTSGGAETNSESEDDSDPDVAKKQFSCSVCRKRFTQIRGVKLHMKWAHSNDKPLTSTESNALLDNDQHSPLQTDTESMTSRPFSCPVCKKRFTQIRGVKLHMKWAHRNEKLLSSAESNAQLDNDQHSTLHEANSEGPEEQVSGRAETNSEAEEEDPNIGCDEDHDTPKKPFSCSVCGKCFTQVRGVKMHMKWTHMNKETLTAESNAQVDSDKHSPLQTDMKSLKGRPFSCPVCKLCFPLLKRLRVHLRSHTDEELFTRPLSCPVCGRQFKLESCLEEHMKGHTGENPFSCTKCTHTFKVEADFLCHMEMAHSVEKPFRCLVCYSDFKSSRDYRSHTLSHTSVTWPFLCSVCGKGFGQRSHLQYHELTHSGEKPFSCSKCGVKYTSKQNLVRHKKVMHH